MSHTYLLDTYTCIERRLEEIHRQMADAGDWKARQHAAGQIQALCDLERFLRANYDAKLPRRLLRHLRKKSAILCESTGEPASGPSGTCTSVKDRF